MEEQPNQELVEDEGEAPATGAVPPMASAVKAARATMPSVSAKNIVLGGCTGWSGASVS